MTQLRSLVTWNPTPRNHRYLLDREGFTFTIDPFFPMQLRPYPINLQYVA
jgi:hypothetical protein